VQRLYFILREDDGSGPGFGAVAVGGFALVPYLDADSPEAVLLPGA
jgi:hypothetical protein